MCGIVGAVAQRDITPILLEGLKRLEYRGYDSCGVAVHANGELRRARSTERVAALEAQVDKDGVQGFTGIAHTRWAPHGAPATTNAHHHFSGQSTGPARITTVHHGFIDKHAALPPDLTAHYYALERQTNH